MMLYIIHGCPIYAALYAGAPNIERVDRLVQGIARQRGERLAAIDEIVELVDAQLAANRRAK